MLSDGPLTPRSVGRNSAVLLAGTIVARAAAFAFTIVLARTFDQAAFALILLAQAASQYLALLVDFGLTIAGIRSVAGDTALARRTMGGVLLVRGTLGLIGIITIWVVVVLLRFNAQAQTVFVLSAVAVAINALDISWVAQGRQSVGPRALVLAGGSVLALALLIVAVSFRPGPEVAPLAQLAGALIFVATAFAVVTRRYGRPSLANGALLRTIIVTSLPVGLATVMAQVYYNLDLILLGVFRSVREVAIYGAAYKVIFGLLALGWTYAIVVLPRLTIAASRGQDVLRDEMRTRVRHFAAVILPVALGAAILAGPILAALFGPTFADGADPFALLLLSVPISSFGSLILYSLVAVRRNWALPISSGCGAVVNVVLNLLLIPRYGMMGAASATLAAVSVVLAVAFLQGRKNLPRVGWASILRLVAALLLMSVVAKATTSLWLPVSAMLAGAAYLLALLASGYWLPEELASARRYLARTFRLRLRA
jgi:O-antigen/teichoic acid export membrane protein